MKKANVFILLLISVFLFSGMAYGEEGTGVTLKLQDGTEIPLDGLNPAEKMEMMKYISKINEQTQKTATKTITETVLASANDPTKLNEWRKLITGTIKDVASDLNVTVNEFVKTPVGLGVASLIFYKVAGKELVTKAVSVGLIIPFWFSICISCAFVAKYFLGHKTEFITVTGSRVNALTDKCIAHEIREVVTDENGVDLDIKIPTRIGRYKWKSNDARTVFGCFMMGIPIAATAISLIVIFA